METGFKPALCGDRWREAVVKCRVFTWGRIKHYNNLRVVIRKLNNLDESKIISGRKHVVDWSGTA